MMTSPSATCSLSPLLFLVRTSRYISRLFCAHLATHRVYFAHISRHIASILRTYCVYTAPPSTHLRIGASAASQSIPADHPHPSRIAGMRLHLATANGEYLSLQTDTAAVPVGEEPAVHVWRRPAGDDCCFTTCMLPTYIRPKGQHVVLARLVVRFWLGLHTAVSRVGLHTNGVVWRTPTAYSGGCLTQAILPPLSTPASSPPSWPSPAPSPPPSASPTPPPPASPADCTWEAAAQPWHSVTAECVTGTVAVDPLVGWAGTERSLCISGSYAAADPSASSGYATAIASQVTCA